MGEEVIAREAAAQTRRVCPHTLYLIYGVAPQARVGRLSNL